LKGADTRALVNHLQSHGIRVLGSSIIGLENHRPENMDAVIDYAIRHDTVFHQFMLYTPIAGTPLYRKLQAEGAIYPESEFPYADAHGQHRFNYHHPAITDGKEESYLLEAFRRDFDVNGPSLLRLIRVLLNGWQRHKNRPGPVRDRFAREVFPLRSTYAGAVWAMRKRYQNDERIAGKAGKLLADIYGEFGRVTRIIAPLIGRYVYRAMKQEEKRLVEGWTYEPTCFCEKNPAATALAKAKPAPAKAEAPTHALHPAKTGPVPDFRSGPFSPVDVEREKEAVI
jgi:hypothetical protein